MTRCSSVRSWFQLELVPRNKKRNFRYVANCETSAYMAGLSMYAVLSEETNKITSELIKSVRLNRLNIHPDVVSKVTVINLP